MGYSYTFWKAHAAHQCSKELLDLRVSHTLLHAMHQCNPRVMMYYAVCCAYSDTPTPTWWYTPVCVVVVLYHKHFTATFTHFAKPGPLLLVLLEPALCAWCGCTTMAFIYLVGWSTLNSTVASSLPLTPLVLGTWERDYTITSTP
jgi:hypothetical protein